MPLEFELRNVNETPPNGFEYTQPESGRVFSDYTYDRFIKDIRDHRLGNGYPITPTWEEELQDEMCRKHPHWFPDHCKRIDSPKLRKVSFASALSFLGMLSRWAFKGAKFVPQEEAERRANICLTCPLNQPLQLGCGACQSTILQGISNLMGSHTTTLDEKLGACGICSCSLKVAVHFPLEAQQFSLTEQMKQEFKDLGYCWKAEGL
jgi:hypothetical protein